jgi:hypothetical protein
LNYVCPPVCEVNFSSSAGPVIVLEPIGKRKSPSGFIISGSGHNFHLAWDNYPGALCYTVYKAVDELNPFGDYIVVAECIQDNFFDGDEGYYRISAITTDGESELSDPINVGVNPAPPPLPVTIEVVNVTHINDLSSNGILAIDVLATSGFFYNHILTPLTELPGTTFGAAYACNTSLHFASENDGFGFNKGIFQIYPSTDFTIGTTFAHGASFVTNASRRMTEDDWIVCNQGYYDGVNHLFVSAASWGGGGISNARVRNIAKVGSNHILSAFDNFAPNLGVYRYTAELLLLENILPLGASVSASNLPLAMNESGHIAGSYTIGGVDRGFLNQSGTGASSADIGLIIPFSINNSKLVVGAYSSQPRMWTQATGVQVVPGLPTLNYGFANDVNSAGDIVGRMSDAILVQFTAFLYRNGVTYDLFSLIPFAQTGPAQWTRLTDALFINDNKQIAGYGVYNGVTTGYLMTVP